MALRDDDEGFCRFVVGRSLNPSAAEVGNEAGRRMLKGVNPLSLNRSEKEAVVTDVTAQVARSRTLALAEYRGLSVEHLNVASQDGAGKRGVYLHVLKNSLARRAVAGTPFEVASPRAWPGR